MRKALLIIGLVVAMVACKKDNTHVLDLAGNWELRSSVGGIAGMHYTFAPGSGNTLTLNADSTYQRYANHALVNHGPFHIIKNSLNFDGTKKLDGIFFDEGSSGEYVILKADTLQIGMDLDDGVANTYVRQK